MKDFVKEMALDVMKILPEARLDISNMIDKRGEFCYLVFSVNSTGENPLIDKNCTKIVGLYHPSEASIMITELYVDPVSRGQGYGKKLLELIEGTGRLMDCERVIVDNTQHIGFFARSGYENKNIGNISFLEKTLF